MYGSFLGTFYHLGLKIGYSFLRGSYNPDVNPTKVYEEFDHLTTYIGWGLISGTLQIGHIVCVW